MSELFESIGFEIESEDTYEVIADYAESSGERSSQYRGNAALHGWCWKMGDGLEVWSVLYDRGGKIYYADCRPAFRSRYVYHVQPWELIEYDEDGEAVICGALHNGTDVIFELQNLTELPSNVFREPHLHVTLAGLAYSVQVNPARESKKSATPSSFELAESLPEYAQDACENDYVISGQVLAWRETRNPVTMTPLIWLYIDAGQLSLEILANRRSVRGRPVIGANVTAHIWLQGHVLKPGDLSMRYEGVDWEYQVSDFWARLRREN